jgi:hypothetical protein
VDGGVEHFGEVDGPAAGAGVRQELGLVGGHVDLHGAVALAAFAREAEVEGVLDGFAAPAVLDDTAVDHLEQDPGPAAGGVLLLAGDLVARTHDAAARFRAAALADPGAAQRRPGESAVVVVAEVRVRLGRRVVGAEPQPVVEFVGVYDLAGVHPVPWIEDRLNSSNAPTTS